MERYWKYDRYALAKLSGCYFRIVCQYHDVRKDIGGVLDEAVCAPPVVPTEAQLRAKPKHAKTKK